MKTLPEFIVRYAQVLYLNPAYRFNDSRTRGLADIDASSSISSDQLRWDIANDRGQIGIPIRRCDTRTTKTGSGFPSYANTSMVVQTLNRVRRSNLPSG